MAAIPTMHINGSVMIQVGKNEPIAIVTFTVPIEWHTGPDSASVVGKVNTARLTHDLDVLAVRLSHDVEVAQELEACGIVRKDLPQAIATVSALTS